LRDAYDRLVRTQTQLVQSERLAAIGELAASVVHEVRNPLSAVKMNVSILQKKYGDDPATKEHFDLARAQIERLDAMLEDLLDYSKPVALNLQTVSILELISDARKTADTECKARNVIIESSLPDSNLTIKADRDRLAQVLLNLLLNALQASPEKSKILVRAEEYYSGNESFVRLSISDQGHGITAENLARVFEPFFTTRKHGTGLGLSNSRKIVEAHGGTLTLESKINTGTTATLTLPKER
jgi:two-component system, NtrC family, sensor histidine kinase HydH